MAALTRKLSRRATACAATLHMHRRRHCRSLRSFTTAALSRGTISSHNQPTHPKLRREALVHISR